MTHRIEIEISLPNNLSLTIKDSELDAIRDYTVRQLEIARAVELGIVECKIESNKSKY